MAASDGVGPGVRLAARCRVFADNTYHTVAGRRLGLDLDRASVPNLLFTATGAGHGDFTEEVWPRAYRSVLNFLQEQIGA